MISSLKVHFLNQSQFDDSSAYPSNKSFILSKIISIQRVFWHLIRNFSFSPTGRLWWHFPTKIIIILQLLTTLMMMVVSMAPWISLPRVLINISHQFLHKKKEYNSSCNNQYCHSKNSIILQSKPKITVRFETCITYVTNLPRTDIPTERSCRECECECGCPCPTWAWCARSSWWSCEWECSPPEKHLLLINVPTK